MAKYNKPRGGQLTLNSTTLVGGISLFLVLLVGGIGGGMYMGYRWGYDAGFQRGSTQAQQQRAESSQSVERWSLSPDTGARSDSPGGTQPGGYTDEDIQFLDEDTAGPGEAGSTGEVSSSDQKSGQQTQSPSGSGGESPSLRTGETSGNGGAQVQDGSSGSETVGQTFTIQTVSTQHEDRALRVVQQLREQGHKVRLTEATVDGTLYYRVRVGSFSSREEAQDYAEKMVKEGEIDDFWISEVRL